jgi:transcriptional regulator with XRE-family HTH domain
MQALFCAFSYFFVLLSLLIHNSMCYDESIFSQEVKKLAKPFGKDVADYNEETSADRIGRRIRAIRMEKGMSQAELGAAMNLSADRIQKYENGARKPKYEMLKQFAYVLGVETIALMDPIVTNYIGAMYAIFEMEHLYDLEVKKVDTGYLLQFGSGFSGTINEYLRAWYEERENIRRRMETASEEERETIMKEYNQWERTFPKSLSDKTAKALLDTKLRGTISASQSQEVRNDG